MPVRVLKNVLDSDITYMELDTYHRKLVVGSHQGEVKVFDIVSGVNILTLDSHDPQEGEISFIGYGGADHTIVTCGWDRVIKVHLDEVYDYSMPQEGGLQPSKPEKANLAKRSSISKAPKPSRVVGGADRF
jgi:WD40 repeat protein